MSDLLGARFRRLFEYESDSHAKVLAAFETVAAERRAAEEFRHALELLAHVGAARGMWLARLGRAEAPREGFFPKAVRLDELARRLAEMEAPWRSYLAGADDAEIQRAFEYASTDAGRFRNTVEEVLTQLHGHSLYHRGQIAARIRALGGRPAETDYIFWARRAVD